MDSIPLLAVIEKRQQSDGTWSPEITRLQPMPWFMRMLQCFRKRPPREDVSTSALNDLHDINIAIGIDQDVLVALYGSQPSRDYTAPLTWAQHYINLILTPSRSLVSEAEGNSRGIRV